MRANEDAMESVMFQGEISVNRPYSGDGMVNGEVSANGEIDVG